MRALFTTCLQASPDVHCLEHPGHVHDLGTLVLLPLVPVSADESIITPGVYGAKILDELAASVTMHM